MKFNESKSESNQEPIKMYMDPSKQKTEVPTQMILLSSLICLQQSAMVCADTVLEVTCHYAIECRLSGRCVDERGAASGVLAAMKHGAFAAIFLDVWSILMCAYALIACGCCRARYTMRDITPGARVVLLGTRTRHARKAS